MGSNWLKMNQSAYRGTLILVLLIGLSGVMHASLPRLFQDDPDEGFEVYLLVPDQVEEQGSGIQPEQIGKERPIQTRIENKSNHQPQETGAERHAGPIDLNRADAKELQALRGIGPVLSERIVKYRDLLGGFHSKNQLKEVYGLDSNLVDALLPDLVLGASELNSLNLKDAEGLKRHPYIDPRQAKRLSGYLRYLGDQALDPDQLIEMGIFTPSELDRLKPYLKL